MKLKKIENLPQKGFLLESYVFGYFLPFLNSAVEGVAKVSKHPVYTSTHTNTHYTVKM